MGNYKKFKKIAIGNCKKKKKNMTKIMGNYKKIYIFLLNIW